MLHFLYVDCEYYLLEKDWIKYPILHLDLNAEKYTTPEALDQVLESALRGWEALYGAQDYEKTFASRFQGIIQRAWGKEVCRSL